MLPSRIILTGAFCALLTLGLSACNTHDATDQSKTNITNLHTISSDVDSDGIANMQDSCLLTANSSQQDMDGDGLGDSCDPDIDGDGITNSPDQANGGALDNCTWTANTNQKDTDKDGIGDACDKNTDTDGDGVDLGIDNCPYLKNGNQADTDNDGKGDACDTDLDGDGIDNGAPGDIKNGRDNCAYAPNHKQTDTNGDGIGDACQVANPTNSQGGTPTTPGTDTDADGILDGQDTCPLLANPQQTDTDGDGIGDLCDSDLDGDSVNNTADSCPVIANADQADKDGDGTGDACDSDIDGDGIDNSQDSCPLITGDSSNQGCPASIDPTADADSDGVINGDDNCRATPNPNQTDTDSDGKGDACDIDQDGDGVDNSIDNCPIAANADQADDDGDGIGNVCDTDGFTCSTGSYYQPLLTPDYSVTTDHSLLCLGCTVQNSGNIVNGQSSSYAQMKIPLALGNPTISAKVNGTQVLNSGINRIGFVVKTPKSPLVDVGLLQTATTISLYKGNTQVASSDVSSSSVLDLGLLGMGSGSDNQKFLSVTVDQNTPDFDSIAIQLNGSTLGVSEEFQVFRACAGTDPAL